MCCSKKYSSSASLQCAVLGNICTPQPCSQGIFAPLPLSERLLGYKGMRHHLNQVFKIIKYYKNLVQVMPHTSLKYFTKLEFLKGERVQTKMPSVGGILDNFKNSFPILHT